MKQTTIFAVIALLLLVAQANPAGAWWEKNGSPICTEPGDQLYQQIVSDGEGGVIATWQDSRNGHWDIYAQRINGEGEFLWAGRGVPICLASGDQLRPRIITDGAHGAIIVWFDKRSGTEYDIYAQRIDFDGGTIWTEGGVGVCTAPGGQERPTLVTDGGGGAIITWFDFRNGASDIFAQRLDFSGNALWTVDGVPVCSKPEDQDWPYAFPSGGGGAFISWYDYRSGSREVYMQRIDPNGEALWQHDGIPISAATDYQAWPQMITDGEDGVVVCWVDSRNGNKDIYAQRVDPDGNTLWAGGGVPVCTAESDQHYSWIASDDAGGAIIAWQDGRPNPDTDWDIFAQRIAPDGSAIWQVDGVVISEFWYDQTGPRVIPDGFGGAVITWREFGCSGASDISGQRVNASGEVLWGSNGLLICGAYGTQSYAQQIPDGEGGAFVIWYDYRNSAHYDLYGSLVNPDKVPPVPDYTPHIIAIEDVPNDHGGKMSIQWERSNLDVYPKTDLSHYSIWRRLPKAESPLVLSTGVDTLGILGISHDYDGPAKRVHLSTPDYAWEWIKNTLPLYFETYASTIPSLFDSTASDPGWQYFMVVAHTRDPRIYYVSAIDSGYSVDNLAPEEPRQLAGVYEPGQKGLILTWQPNEEPDISHYAVYRGLSQDFTPAAANRIANPSETRHFDGQWKPGIGYYYKVSAVDVHDNESPYAVLRPEDISGNATPGLPENPYLAQNIPNPFNPTTRISFGITEPATVSIRIYDASGKLVRILLEGGRSPGHYDEVWDGCNGNGLPVASGVYFYRLRAGNFTQTRKMVLTK